LVWAQLVVSLFVEAIAYARGRKAGAVPLAGGPQRAAARLVATIALLGALVSTRTPNPAVATRGGPLAGPAPVAVTLVDDRAPDGGATVDGAPAVAPAPVCSVQRRDTLWGIAERHLGDPLRWSEIFQLNEGRPQTDGGCLTDPDHIVEGWRLVLPADARVDPVEYVAGPDGDETAATASGDGMVLLDDEDVSAAGIGVDQSPATAEAPGEPTTSATGTTEPDSGPETPVTTGSVPIAEATQVAATPGPAAIPGEVTVEGGDNFWSLAEEQLTTAWGRPPTDAEIVPHWQALVEQNRAALAPPGDPDLIYPGQVFTVPTPPPDPSALQTLSPAEPSVPASGAPASPPVTEAPDGPSDEGDTPPPDDSLDDGTAPGESVVPGEVQAGTDAISEVADDEGGGSSVAATGLVGGGVALAGALVLLERRRRAQQRHRRRGRVIPMPPGQAHTSERRLRWGADIEGARLLDVALRAAAASAGATGLPRLAWAEASADSVLLVLTAPAPAPAGFAALDAWHWITSAPLAQLEQAGARSAAPAPTFVPVGTTDRGTELLVELESAGVVTVDGPRAAVAGLLRSIVVALSTAVWSDQARVVAVGFEPDLARLPGVESAATLADALQAAEEHAEATEAALRSLHCPTVAQARAVGAMPEAWDPLVIVSAVPPGERTERRRLEDLARRDNATVGMVVVPSVDSGLPGRRFSIGDHGYLEIDGVNEAVQPRALGGDEAVALVGLLVYAQRRGDVAPDPTAPEMSPRRPPPPPPPLVVGGGPEEAAAVPPPVAPPPPAPPPPLVVGGGPEEAAAAPPPAPAPPVPGAAPASSAPSAPAGPGPDGDPDPPAAATVRGEPASPPRERRDRLSELLAEVAVVVRVLGEVRAVRVTGPGGQGEPMVPTRQRALEAITYLALRESAVDREDLEISLFPAGANAAKTVYNTISSARALLGDDLFPPPGAGRYELSPAVVTDYGVFCELVAEADETDDALFAADMLHQALSLVQGEPFTGVGRSYSWVGPHRGMIVAQVVDAAEELAEVRLAMGDWRSAEWAARQGLRAFPSDERMYRLLMRTARAAGNIPGVQRVFRELCDVLADPDIGVEPEDTVHPETIELLEQLTGAPPREGRLGA
jgi:DNA-binding SARP family transcriptional activator/nucleoid-associated protein YgaU